MVVTETLAVPKWQPCGEGGTDNPQQSNLSGHQPQQNQFFCFEHAAPSFAVGFVCSEAASCSFSSATLQMLKTLLCPRRAGILMSFTCSQAVELLAGGRLERETKELFVAQRASTDLCLAFRRSDLPWSLACSNRVDLADLRAR